MKTVTALIGALVLSTNASAQLSLPEAIAEGKPFPGVVLPGLEDGRPASIADFRGSKVVLPAYALYYVCEGAGGACLYRRQDIEIRLAFARE